MGQCVVALTVKQKTAEEVKGLVKQFGSKHVNFKIDSFFTLYVQSCVVEEANKLVKIKP